MDVGQDLARKEAASCQQHGDAGVPPAMAGVKGAGLGRQSQSLRSAVAALRIRSTCWGPRVCQCTWALMHVYKRVSACMHWSVCMCFCAWEWNSLYVCMMCVRAHGLGVHLHSSSVLPHREGLGACSPRARLGPLWTGRPSCREHHPAPPLSCPREHPAPPQLHGAGGIHVAALVPGLAQHRAPGTRASCAYHAKLDGLLEVRPWPYCSMHAPSGPSALSQLTDGAPGIGTGLPSTC